MQTGFNAWEETPLARWLVAAAPSGELIGRQHFGPMADKFITARPVHGTMPQLMSRPDFLAMPGAEARLVGFPSGKNSPWVTDGAGALDPIAPITVLQTSGPVVGVAGQANAWQIAAAGVANPSQVLLPVQVMNSSRRKLRIYFVLGDNGTTDSLTFGVFLGTTGTAAGDTQLYAPGAAIPAANRSTDGLIEIQRLTATTVQVWIRTWTFGTTVLPTAITVPNMDTNPLYLSWAMKMGGATDIPTTADLRIELS